jgi:arginyl-tRNA synthetase
LEKQDAFGHHSIGQGKRVLVEFSSPNIAKPFHAGHLRSTIIGNFVRNIHNACGYETIAMNYLGDWGKQYGLLAVGFARFGSEEALVQDPIKHLYDVYVEVNKVAETEPTIHDEARAYFRKMEDGDEDALGLWKRFRNLSIDKYKDTYAKLNVAFDVYSGESQVTKGMNQAMEMLRAANLLQESEGALIIDMKKEKLGTCVIQKKDGTTLYITRDIGAALERYEQFQFDKMYYVVASQQELHLRQLFAILKRLGLPWADRCEHISYGLVTGMSTRKGTAVFLEDILDQTRETMHDQMKQNQTKYEQVHDPEGVSHLIGLSAVVVQDMSARKIKNYEFDWTRMFSFEGDTGPYLQYAHARLCSIARKVDVPVNAQADLTLLTQKSALDLVVHMARYPDVIKAAHDNLEPCTIVTYAMELSHLVSVALEELWVMNQEASVRDARLAMYWSAKLILGNAMKLIGLVPLERM